MQSDSFTQYVIEQLSLSGVGEIEKRRMFSSVGLYLDGKFFGIVSGDTLFFKTNDATRQPYVQRGMKPFAPSKDQVLKNYYEVPPEVLESPRELGEWARAAASIL